MADYDFLHSKFTVDDFRNRCEIAVRVAAYKVSDDSANFPSTTADQAIIDAREQWAADVIRDTGQNAGSAAMRLVLAANSTVSNGAIDSALTNDATIQSNVDAVVDILACHPAVSASP